MADFLSIGMNTTLESGAATSTVADELNDTAATFVTNGVQVGDIVYNTTDDTSATITVVDSETVLTLSANIMANTETYVVVSATLETEYLISSKPIFVNQASTTSCVISYASPALNTCTITHTAGDLQQAIQTAMKLAASHSSAPDSATDVIKPIGMALSVIAFS